VTSRKERRKLERQQAKAQRAGAAVRNQNAVAPPSIQKAGKPQKTLATGKDAQTNGKPPKSILKKGRPELDEEDEDLSGFEDELDEEEEGDGELSDDVLDEGSEEGEEDEGSEEEGSELRSDEDIGEDLGLDDDDDFDEGDGEDLEDDDVEGEAKAPKRKIPKALEDAIKQDDKQIRELERKLGIKNRKKLPKVFKDDGLDELLEDLDNFLDDMTDRQRQKAEEQEWLAQKRRKAEAAAAKTAKEKENKAAKEDKDGKKTKEKAARESKKRPEPESDEEEDLDEEDMDDLDEDVDEDMDQDIEGFDEDDMDDFDEEAEEDEDMEDEDESQEDDFEGFSEDDNADEPPAKRVRENPYVPPTTGQVAKYVPPSLRKETSSDSELASRVRRQTQGLVNRITESNMLTILGEIEKLYREYPRQHVTSSLVDLLLIQVCDQTSLPDSLLILTAGFATAAYMVIGTDFGGQLIQEVVERFDKYYEEAKKIAEERPDVPKQTSNLITFVAQIYTFQLIGPNLVFDYIRMLLESLSELNAELLLRIVRICGPALRQDDPMALKDIVALIPPAVQKAGGQKNLTVRTKFMIDTITDLKNNKMKAGVGATAIIVEHTTRIKKILSQLKSRRLKATEPMGIGLKDIREADKQGKWWLVGASWAGRSKDDKKPKTANKDDESDDDDSIIVDDVEDGPDLAELAREQGMNTEVRRAIFVAIMSAMDYQDAYLRIMKLRLNKERQREVPNVIIRCVGAEQHYNPYYTLVAKHLCAQQREVRWSFQASLWKLFGRMGENEFGDEEDEPVEDEAGDADLDMRRLVNTAKMYGSLLAANSLPITMLKRLNLVYPQRKTRDFVELMLVTALLELQQKSEKPEEAIVKVFGAVEATPDLAKGLQYFLKKVVRKSDLAGGKEKTKLLKEACKMAEAAVETAMARAEELV